MDLPKLIFNTLGFSYTGSLSYVARQDVYVRYRDRHAVIANGNISCLNRGLMLLVKSLRAGKTDFEITQTPCFRQRGIQLDLSRNGVMTVNAIKIVLNHMAALGLNALILYMEDVFKLEGYPYFGYMRGAYSRQELKEIDDYANDLGIEVIPHIQTLAHMEKYLQWKAAAPVRNTANALLCEEPATFALIEAMIKTMRACFRSRQIHIGCDEAASIQEGAYLRKHGLRSVFAIMKPHIDTVVQLCEKYDFRPIVYSDLYFSLNSPDGIHYSPETVFPENFETLIPKASLMYWDYGQPDQQHYEDVIRLHRKLGRDVKFLGGIWGWGDLLPKSEFTFRSLPPALRACIRCGVEDVFASTWGDDGNECNKMYELFYAPILSEIAFRGGDTSLEDCLEMSEFLFGTTPDFFTAAGEMALPLVSSAIYGYDELRNGKALFYADILYNLTGETDFYAQAQPRYAQAAAQLSGSVHNSRWKAYEAFAIRVYEILAAKCGLITGIREAYLSGDKTRLRQYADTQLPALEAQYTALLPLWQKMWLSVYKPFGWEVLNIRLAGLSARLRYAQARLEAYLAEEIPAIDELEEPLLTDGTLAPRQSIRVMTAAGSL